MMFAHGKEDLLMDGSMLSSFRRPVGSAIQSIPIPANGEGTADVTFAHTLRQGHNSL